MRAIIAISLILAASVGTFAQTVVGGSGWCKTSGDPNSVASLQGQDARFDCSQVWDTVNLHFYYFDPGQSPGSKWVRYDQAFGDNLGNHLATQDVDMDGNQIVRAERIMGGVGPGPTDNVGQLVFNTPVGSTVVGNATVLSHNASVLIASDQNGNAITPSDEPVILAQGSTDTDNGSYTELLRAFDGGFRILDAYDMHTTAPPSDGSPYAMAWTNGSPSWLNTDDFFWTWRGQADAGGIFSIGDNDLLVFEGGNGINTSYSLGTITFDATDPSVTNEGIFYTDGSLTGNRLLLTAGNSLKFAASGLNGGNSVMMDFDDQTTFGTGNVLRFQRNGTEIGRIQWVPGASPFLRILGNNGAEMQFNGIGNDGSIDFFAQNTNADVRFGASNGTYGGLGTGVLNTLLGATVDGAGFGRRGTDLRAYMIAGDATNIGGGADAGLSLGVRDHGTGKASFFNIKWDGSILSTVHRTAHYGLNLYAGFTSQLDTLDRTSDFAIAAEGDPGKPEFSAHVHNDKDDDDESYAKLGNQQTTGSLEYTGIDVRRNKVDLYEFNVQLATIDRTSYKLLNGVPLELSTWTTGTRPGTPAVGMMGYNSTTGKVEGYFDSQWNEWGTGSGGGGIFQVENSTTIATDNTTNNYHRGYLAVGDFSSNTIGAPLHLYDPNLVVRLSDSCNTAQCATPQLEFYQGRSTSLLGRVGFLSSGDNDFSFINQLAAGRLKFGTDATVKMEILASGQLQLNQYTATSSFTGTAVGYLGFDANGNVLTTSGTGGGGTFLSLTDAPGSYSGEAGSYLVVNPGETGLEFTTVAPGGGDVSHHTNLSPTVVDGGSTSVNFSNNNAQFVTINMGSATRTELNFLNPQGSIVPNYNIHFKNVTAGADTITFPDNVLLAWGDSLLSRELHKGWIAEFWYDGINFWCNDSLGNVVSVPTGGPAGTCFDGVQNGTETGIDCGGPCYPCNSYQLEYQHVLNYADQEGYSVPDATNRTQQNTLMTSLVTDNVLDSLDVFYVFATNGDRDFAKIDWVNPTGSYEATEVGTLTFTASQGFKSDGTTGYLNTNLSLRTDSASLHYSADYGQIIAHLHTGDIDWPTATAICGARASSGVNEDQQILIQNNANDQTIVRMQSHSTTNGTNDYLLVTTPIDLTGTFMASRTDWNTLAAFHNNVFNDANSTGAVTTEELPAANMALLALNTNGTITNYNTAELSFWGIGTFHSLRLDFHNALSTYKTALGL